MKKVIQETSGDEIKEEKIKNVNSIFALIAFALKYPKSTVMILLSISISIALIILAMSGYSGGGFNKSPVIIKGVSNDVNNK